MTGVIDSISQFLHDWGIAAFLLVFIAVMIWIGVDALNSIKRK